MKRVRIVVAYDGTNYCGWQIQPNGITIEEVLNKALCKLTGEEIRIIGASRTDSGVHALGNVAVFDTESSIPAERIAYALNQRLPEDIVVVKSEEVPCDWHPRYQSKVTKTYEYRIYNDQTKNPLRRQYTAFVSFPMDIEKMRELTDDIRLNLPAEVRQAKAIVNDRAEIITTAKKEAASIVKKAEDKARAIVNQDDLTKAAQQKAAEIISQAQMQAREMRQAATEFADNLMKSTEQFLVASMEEVKETRAKLRGRKK